jgi:copper chaperone CopZ
MKIILTTVALALALSARAAEVTVTITDVHICCQSCVKAIAKAVAGVNGLTAKADRDARTITLTGPDTAAVQKGADALVTAGYFGKSSDATIAINNNIGTYWR